MKTNLNFYTLLRGFKHLIFNSNSFVHSTGWLNSLNNLAPVDQDNKPIPWMNYHFVEFLSKRLNRGMEVFEYGSGNSTYYWSSRVKSVISVEYNESWYDKMKDNLPDNVKLVFNKEIETNGYAEEVKNHSLLFDIIIIDGRNRIDCINISIHKLKRHGIIILDDSHEPKYMEAFKILTEMGFNEITISGIKPVSNKFASSTIFYQKENCLNI